MSNPTGCVEMSYDEWANQFPDEANATDLDWLDDYGSDLMHAVSSLDRERLKEWAVKIEQHWQDSIGSTGAARRREAADRDARRYQALRLRMETFQQIVTALRSPDLGRRSEAIGTLIGMMTAAQLYKVHSPQDQTELAAAQIKAALPAAGESKCATDTE